MAGKDAPSSFKKSPSPALTRVDWKPKAQPVTQIEAEPQVNPKPVQPEGQLESRGDSQVTSARSSSVIPLLSASISLQPGERQPQKRSSPQELSTLLSPLSFQAGLPETKILVESIPLTVFERKDLERRGIPRPLSVFVYTDLEYLGKPRPGVGESSGEQSDLWHPKAIARSGIPAVSGPRASGSAGFSDLTLPQSAGKPETMPTTIRQSREISETLEKATNIFLGVVKVSNPSAAPVGVSCVYIQLYTSDASA